MNSAKQPIRSTPGGVSGETSYAVRYLLTKTAKMALSFLFLVISLLCIVQISRSMTRQHWFDFAVLLPIFLGLLILCAYPFYRLVIQGQAVLEIQPEHILVASPFLFDHARISIDSIQTIHLSPWKRSFIEHIDADQGILQTVFFPYLIDRADHTSMLENFEELNISCQTF